MKHIHADNMLLYAQDAQETDKPWENWEWRWSSSTSGHWVKAEASDIEWDLEIDYRRIDPYRELKEAQMRGKTIQVQTTDHGTCWGDRCYPCCIYWDLPPDRYRVKPEADPYKHLREAQERGEPIECRQSDGEYRSFESYKFNFNQPIGYYRIKPPEYNCRVKPKTVKKWQWKMSKHLTEKEMIEKVGCFPISIPRQLGLGFVKVDGSEIEVEA